MANLGQAFDATQVEPSAPRQVLPPGEYRVHIVASQMKATKNGNGQYLEIEMDVLDGEFINRKLWDRLNLDNLNSQAVEIAHRTLSAICHAVGVFNVSDSEQLHFRPMIAVVKVAAPREAGQEPTNEVKGYKPAAAAAPPPQQRLPAAVGQQRPRASPPPPPPPPAAASSPPAGKMPWHR